MPGARDLKRRILSVKNTQQTTRAMKMVSAAKLRRAQDAILNQRPYAKRIGTLVHLLSSLPEVTLESPLLKKERIGLSEFKKTMLLVVITSDRGLCGGFNSSAIKMAMRWVHAHSEYYKSIELAFVGKKGYEYFKNKKFKIGPFYSEFSGKVTFAKAKGLADRLIEKYLNEDLDEVKVIYNEFKNAILQKPIVEDFLPVHSISQTFSAGEFAVPVSPEKKPEELPLYLVKPNIETILQ
ncbi:MAG: F0F1 ATP synthase subunit gamma, partial [Bdellovibrio sp.]|nr:F0F1 ATP synthase subunit gamma [Bdellovibrio sp.]